MTEIPEHLLPLLENPNFGALATVRPDGSPQVNTMWFEKDGDTIRFTHTSKRAKFRNLQQNPGMSMVVFDPDMPYHQVEVRGQLAEVIPDPGGSFYLHLARRYGNENPTAPADADDRVILVMSIDRAIGR